MQLLGSNESFDEVVQQNEASITNPNTTQYLLKLLDMKSKTIQEVIQKANLSRSFGYQVFNGLRNPTRNILIKMAFAMELTIDETQHLLKIAQRGELYPRVRRDAAIIFCIQNKCSLYDVEELLDTIGEPQLS